MKNLIDDIIGKQFGYLTVIEKTDKKDKGRHYYFKCICACGKETLVTKSALTSGNTISCGCFKVKKNKERIKTDLTGKKFGKLTALYPTEKRMGDRTLWMCECECGAKNILVDRNSLITGHTQSCGCLQSIGELKIASLLSKANIYFEKQKTFENCLFEDTNKPAVFDFWVNNQYIIEYDGIQHFQEIPYFKDSLKDRQDKDNFKNNWCHSHNIPIIRIPYTIRDNLLIDDLLLTSKFIVKSESR